MFGSIKTILGIFRLKNLKHSESTPLPFCLKVIFEFIVCPDLQTLCKAALIPVTYMLGQCY